jgi:hypothetical protein
MYPTFYKSDLDKTVQSLREKIISDGILIDNDTADSLVHYFRNECISLSEDEHSEFFKNGNEKANSDKKRRQQEQQQQQKPKRPYSTSIPTREKVIYMKLSYYQVTCIFKI